MHSRKSSKLVLQTANCLKKDFERLSLTSPAIRVIIKTDRVMDVPKGSCTHYLMCSRQAKTAISQLKMHKLAFFKVVISEKIHLLEACFMSPMAELVEMTEKVVTVP